MKIQEGHGIGWVLSGEQQGLRLYCFILWGKEIKEINVLNMGTVVVTYLYIVNCKV